jgi:hypothetical protein
VRYARHDLAVSQGHNTPLDHAGDKGGATSASPMLRRLTTIFAEKSGVLREFKAKSERKRAVSIPREGLLALTRLCRPDPQHSCCFY